MNFIKRYIPQQVNTCISGIKFHFNALVLFRLFFIFFLSSFTVRNATAQSKNVTEKVIYPVFSGGLQLPLADMAKRFATNGLVGTGFYFQTNRGNTLGLSIDFMFGDKVREDSIMTDLLTQRGFLIGLDGLLYEPIMQERAYHFQFLYGHLFSFNKQNEFSGLWTAVQVGFLQHKIRFQFDEPSKLPQLSKELKKGYDRLTNGITFSEFVGWQYLSDNHMINYRIGLETVQGFTRNRRSVNFNTGLPDNSLRKDFLMGLKFSWILPFYLSGGSNKEYIY